MPSLHSRLLCPDLSYASALVPLPQIPSGPCAQETSLPLLGSTCVPCVPFSLSSLGPSVMTAYHSWVPCRLLYCGRAQKELTAISPSQAPGAWKECPLDFPHALGSGRVPRAVAMALPGLLPPHQMPAWPLLLLLTQASRHQCSPLSLYASSLRAPVLSLHRPSHLGLGSLGTSFNRKPIL